MGVWLTSDHRVDYLVSRAETRAALPPGGNVVWKLHQLVVRNQAIPLFEKHCQLLAGHVCTETTMGVCPP